MNQVILFLLILNILNKTSVTGNTYNAGADEANYNANKVGKNKTEFVVPLKHLSNFWKSLNIPLINCEVELILTCSRNCVLADMTERAAGNNNARPAIVAPTGLEFKMTDKNCMFLLLLCQK